MSRSLLAAGLIGGLAMALLGGSIGCEDASARHRAEAGEALEAAAAEFQSARVGTVTPDDAQFDSVQTQLNGVVTRLASLNEGDPGQLAAGSLLASNALRELADMGMLESQAIERRLRTDRNVIHNDVTNARHLGALVDGMTSVTAEDQRAKIDQRRQAAQQQLDTLTDRIEELDGPINERTRLNTDDAERIQNLRREANELLRQAMELGHAGGFETYQQAVRQRREADRIEHGMAHRDLDLNLELLPEQNLAETRAEDLRALLESIGSALDDLEAFEQTYATEIARIREEIARLRRGIMDGVGTINETMNGALASAYDRSIEQLQRAETEARQAAGRLRGADTNAARLVEARNLASHGTQLWMRAVGLDDQIDLLQSIDNAQSALGDVSEARRQLEAIMTTRSDLVSEARTQFTSATNILTQVTGRGLEAANDLRSNLQFMIDSLAGAEIDPSSVEGEENPADAVGDAVNTPR